MQIEEYFKKNKFVCKLVLFFFANKKKSSVRLNPAKGWFFFKDAQYDTLKKWSLRKNCSLELSLWAIGALGKVIILVLVGRNASFGFLLPLTLMFKR